MKRAIKILVILTLGILLTGCFGWPFKTAVDSDHVGVIREDGVTTSEIVGAGRYGSTATFAKMTQIDVSSRMIEWEDPDLSTKDKQILGFKVGVQYRRDPNPESVRLMWEIFRREAIDDDALEALAWDKDLAVVCTCG